MTTPNNPTIPADALLKWYDHERKLLALDMEQAQRILNDANAAGDPDVHITSARLEGRQSILLSFGSFITRYSQDPTNSTADSVD